MMAVLKDCLDLIPSIMANPESTLPNFPDDDGEVYQGVLRRRADTVGMFQVESRAQMASLPRNKPTLSSTTWSSR